MKTEYVFKNPNVLNGGSEAVTDGRYVSIQLFHSFMSMPDEGYEPRYDDPRVGYFLNYVNDMTETGTTNYRDMINRWRLQKKNPDQEISEPVKPITWWIENSTPMEWRETIREGVLEWNKSFEKASKSFNQENFGLYGCERASSFFKKNNNFYRLFITIPSTDSKFAYLGIEKY